MGTSFVLGLCLIFLGIVVFFKTEKIANAVKFVIALLLFVGLPAGVLFVLAHFIIKYW